MNFPPQTFVFVGRSGCGKGTQAELLKKYLSENDSGRDIFYVETGNRFRKFISGNSHASSLSKDIYERAERQPDFLATWMWAEAFVEGIKGGEHILIDGTPRSLPEAMMLSSAVEFFKLGKPHIVYMDVSEDWSRERLLGRGRSDDLSSEKIEKRLEWFKRDVVPALEYLKDNKKYFFHEINGEQTISQVHKEIVSKVFGK